MKTIQLKVPTIKCEGCVEKIRETLTKRRVNFRRGRNDIHG